MNLRTIINNRLRLSALLVAATLLATSVAPTSLVLAEQLTSTTDNNTTVSTSEVANALRDTSGVLESSDQVKTTSDADSAIQAVTAGASVDIPKDASDGVTLGSADGTKPAIDISLPNADNAGDAKQVAPGTVAYPANNGSANAVQATEDGGVRMLTVIDNPSAPTTYDYKVTVPGGGRIELTQNGGVVILDGERQFVGGVSIPWAKDANNTVMNTYFTTDGLTLTQHIDHSTPGTVYPVTADPWFGIKLIDHVRWVGATLQVYPTTWARYWAGPEARGTAWNDIVRAAPGANRPTMRDQFYCHWDLVRLRAPNKPSWNLDLNRPDVGYWTMVRKQCNP